MNEARREACAAGVDDRVTFTAGDAAHVPTTGTCDLVTTFETLHDMADPVGALRTALGENGTVFIDDKVAGRVHRARGPSGALPVRLVRSALPARDDG